MPRRRSILMCTRSPAPTLRTSTPNTRVVQGRRLPRHHAANRSRAHSSAGLPAAIGWDHPTASDPAKTITKPNIKDEIKVERPPLHKVILVNDDYTPREFVVTVLKAEFRMSEEQALRVMITAHQRGVVSSPSIPRMSPKPRRPTRRTRPAASVIRCCSQPSRKSKKGAHLSPHFG